MARLQARAAKKGEKSRDHYRIILLLGCALVVMYAICGVVSKAQQEPKGCLLGISCLGVH